jgi:hypothetical protein
VVIELDEPAVADDGQRVAQRVPEDVEPRAAVGGPRRARRAAQNFLIRPTAIPCTLTSFAGTLIACMLGFAGCRRTILPSG